MFVVTYRRSRPFKLANTSLGIEVIMFEDNRLNNDNNEKRLSSQMNKLMQLYIYVYLYEVLYWFSALWCSICRSRERHMLRQGENRLYSHPYKPVSWMFTHQGKNSDQRTITKQACRDESTSPIIIPNSSDSSNRKKSGLDTVRASVQGATFSMRG